MTTQVHDYKVVVFLMGATVLVMTLLIAYSFYYYERRRLEGLFQVQAGETQIRTILDTVAEGIITTDHQGRIESQNPAATKIFGYASGEFVDDNINMLIPGLSVSKLDICVQCILVSGEKYASDCAVEFDGQHQDGAVFPIEITVSEMVLVGTRHFIICVRDITLRERARQEQREYSKILEWQVENRTVSLREALAITEKASNAKSQFLSRMSHELRTPMNAILGFGQMLEMDVEDFNEIQKSNVKEILDAGHHLLKLIDEVLDLAKIESGQLDISMNNVHVDDLLRQCLTLIGSQAAGRHLELRNNTKGKGYVVNADFVRLKQVLLNLLSNAVKYNLEHGCITIDCNVVGKHHLRISISDTGNGLSEEEISKLFSPFERLNAANNVEGTGIGLAISKHLIELMGGVIGIDSALGKGSVFWIELALSNKT